MKQFAIHRLALVALGIILFGSVPAAGQDAFVSLLDESPRHHEWVEIEHDGRTVAAFVAYPEVEDPAHSVVVIHENRGLNDWVRTVADRLAEAGYIAIAPDLLSGMGPDGGRTPDFESSDAARSAIYDLGPNQVTADLRAVADYVRSLPAADGTVSVAGFCWGGSQSFRFATNYAELTAAFVFYGTAPESNQALARIEAPVYGFYGGNDERVNATIETTAYKMDQLEKTYEPAERIPSSHLIEYEGAGHGFMRRGVSEGASESDAEATQAAWNRWLDLLGE